MFNDYLSLDMYIFMVIRYTNTDQYAHIPELPYSGLFSRRLYFAKAQPILENKNLERHLMWEQAWFDQYLHS